ncbi:MAG: pseudaminic acid cytidylyltransferase [Pseudomonadota bacterium]
MRRIALIPARGGSKRIPRKNIRHFADKPIIAWSIEAALTSKLFDAVMVSTDDAEIAAIAQAYGAWVPFLRSAETAGDHSTTFDVIKEVVEHLEHVGQRVSEMVCLYPCAPMVTPNLLRKGVAMLESRNCDAVIPVVAGHVVQRAMCVNDGRLRFREPRFAQARSQDLESTFFDSGQFYCFRVAPVLAAGSVLTANTAALLLDESRVQNIDTEADWLQAHWKFQQFRDVA